MYNDYDEFNIIKNKIKDYKYNVNSKQLNLIKKSISNLNSSKNIKQNFTNQNFFLENNIFKQNQNINNIYNINHFSTKKISDLNNNIPIKNDCYDTINDINFNNNIFLTKTKIAFENANNKLSNQGLNFKDLLKNVKDNKIKIEKEREDIKNLIILAKQTKEEILINTQNRFFIENKKNLNLNKIKIKENKFDNCKKKFLF